MVANKISYEYRGGILVGIRGEYALHLDLVHIHGHIVKAISSQKNQLLSMKQELSRTKIHTPGATDILGNINRITKAHNNYEINAMTIIDRYTENDGNEFDTVNFSTANTSSGTHIPDQRITQIQNYLDLLTNIITVDIVMSIPVSSDECIICGKIYDEDIDENICTCGHMQPQVNSKEVSLSSKSNYLDCENFQKTLAKYEGFITIDEEQLLSISLKLDDYFHSYGKPIGKIIREQPLNKYGWKDGTSYELMCDALRAINMPIYEYVSSICHHYWHYNLPDISAVRSQVIDDYIKTQPVFNRIIKQFPALRKSSLNTGFRMFKHLQLRGHPCREEEFRIVKTYDIRVIHDRVWWVMMDLTGLKYIPTV